MDLALRVGELLLSNGAGTADVQATMSSICRHLGLRGTYVDVTYIMLTVIHQADLDEVPLALRRNVSQRVTDFEDVTAIDRVVADLLADRIDLEEARRRVVAIETSGHSRPRWSIIAGSGLLGAGVAIMLGGTWTIALIAAVAGCLIEWIRGRLQRRNLPEFYVQIAGALCASLIAVAATAAGISADSSFVVAANIVVLLAGLGFIAAIQDALTGYYLTAGARLLEVVISTTGIVVGVAGGLMVGRLLGVSIAGVGTLPSSPAVPMVGVGAALAATAFAHSAYAPARILAPTALIGGAAATVAAVLTRLDVDRAWAAGLAAVLIGIVAFPVSRWGRVPSLVIVVSAIVPMLPGLTIYRALTQLSENNLVGLFSGITAAAVAIALAAGVLFGELLAQPRSRDSRRREKRIAGPRLVGPLRGRRTRRR